MDADNEPVIIGNDEPVGKRCSTDVIEMLSKQKIDIVSFKYNYNGRFHSASISRMSLRLQTDKNNEF